MFSKTFASKFNILISTFLFSSLIFSSDVEVMIDPNSFIDDGMGEETYLDAEGDLWAYGDKQEEVSYMWNY